MSNPQPDPIAEPALPDDQTQWSEPKIIDGAQCRQCKRCGNWFHIGWTAYHGCAVSRQYRLFDPPEKLS